MISALTWIPRGAAREHPIRYEFSEDEMKMVVNAARNEENVAVEDYETNVRKNKDIEEEGPLGEENDNMEPEEEAVELPAEFDMDNYDNDEVMAMDDDGDMEDEDDVAVTKIGDKMYALDDDDESEDEDDNMIKPSDNILLTAVTTKDEQSELQVWILTDDDDEENGDGGVFYLHHDIILPDMPLCLAWMDIPPFRSTTTGQCEVGNYVAVGTFAPVIEIWNLDVLDPLEPTASLGGEDDAKMSKIKPKKGKKEKIYYKPGSHTSAVMGLHWNTSYRQALASCSADRTVKVWDVTVQNCLSTFTHHTDKVQSVKWNPNCASLLASGSYDKSITLLDCLAATPIIATYRTDNMIDHNSGLPVLNSASSDIESMQWNPFNEHELLVSFENGYVGCIDKRNTTGFSYCFQAHEKTVSSISYSKEIPGMLCTASVDKTVKIWDMNNVTRVNQLFTHPPKCLAYKTMGVGKILSMDYSYIKKNTTATTTTAAAVDGNTEAPEVDRKITNTGGYLLACGGDSNDGAPAVWYSDELMELTGHFTYKSNKNVTALTVDHTVDASAEDTKEVKKSKKKKEKK